MNSGCQFGKALGSSVTAISSHKNKEEECKKLGADAFIASDDHHAMAAAARSLDAILTTVDVDLDWSKYLKLIKPDGKLIFVGLPNEKITLK